MMNLALNISLTDEQYNELMSKTHSTLYESEEFVKELSNVILTNIGQYLRDHPSEIKEALGISIPYYNSNKTQLENKKLMELVIKQAASDYSKEISEAVKDTIKSVLSKTNMTDIITEVVSKAILKGLCSGMNDHIEAIYNTQMITQADIDNLKSRIGI